MLDWAAEHLLSVDERVRDIAAAKRYALREPLELLRNIGKFNLRELVPSVVF